VRALLERRGGSSSRFKDAVMKLGGKGFVLFARVNPDTPGKLAAHAYSYEALEQASYALLGEVAAASDDDEAVETARRIEDEEIAMKDRLAGCFDETVEASLQAGPDDLQEQLRKYLADAHALEEQSIGLLERAAARDGGALSEAYEEHLNETRDQSEAIEERLQALGGDPSGFKDAAMRLGAINWATFFEAHPDTAGKRAAFAYAFEHLELGGYEQLLRVARHAGDEETARLASRIIEQERNAADTIAGLFPEAARAALAEATA
jgi:ferritin-like metal-binding protein YciE